MVESGSSTTTNSLSTSPHDKNDASTSIVPLVARRVLSPVFQQTPFTTNFLHSGKDEDLAALKDKWKSYISLVDHLLEYERNVFGLHEDDDTGPMRELLKIHVEPSEVHGAPSTIISKPDARTNFNPAQHASLCSLLSLLRYIDVLASVKNIGGKAPVMSRRPDIDVSEIPPIYESLEDWPRILLDLRELIDTTPAETIQPVKGGSTTWQLLQCLQTNRNALAQSKILSNFLVVAVHLAYMRETSFTAGTLPDLPEQIGDDIIRRALPSDAKFLEELKAFVDTLTTARNRTTSGVSLTSFRALFHVSTLWSPIILLLRTVLAKKVWSRKRITYIAACLGNEKPPALLASEEVLWETLIELSEGKLQPNQFLLELKARLPWSLIEEASRSRTQSSWFRLGEPSSTEFAFATSILPAENDAGDSTRDDMSVADTVQSQGIAALSSISTDYNAESNPISPPQQNDDSDNMSISPSRSATTPSEMQGCESADASSAMQITTVEPRHLHGPVSPASGRLEGLAKDVDVPPQPSTMNTEGENVDLASQLSTSSTSEFSDQRPRLEGLDAELQAEEHPSQVPPFQPRKSTPIKEVQGRNSTGPLPKSNPHSSSVAPLKRKRKQRKEKSVPSPSKKPLGTLGQPLPSRSLPHSDSLMSIAKAGSGSKVNPIDVDLFSHLSAWEPDNLDVLLPKTGKKKRLEAEPRKPVSEHANAVPHRHKCTRPFTVFDTSGRKVVIEPEFPFKDYAARVEEILAGVENFYIQDRPLHLADPCNSIIHILTYDEFSEMPAQQLHRILIAKNVIVRGTPTPLHEFDAKGLRFMHPLHTTVALQDYSLNRERQDQSTHEELPGDSDEDDLDREDTHLPETIEGSLLEVLDELSAPNGRILNASNIPLYRERQEPTKFSTDSHAWHQTRGREGFPSSEVYPVTDTCWGLAGHRNTMTFFHMDSDGFLSRERIVCGGQVWIFYRERKDMPLSSREAFLARGFRLDRYKKKSAQYDLEAVYLSKGDFLLMRPNQPHAVYGAEPTIIHGGHFYLTTSMEMTAVGLMHSFIMDDYLTNTAHFTSRLLLRHIVDFYRQGLLEKKIAETDPSYDHLPDVQTFPGLINLLSLCNLVILGNALDFRTYSAPNQKASDKDVPPHRQILVDRYDRNNIPKQERYSIMYARGVALELIRWVRDFCTIISPEGKVIPDLPSRYLCKQLRALLAYKKEAEEKRIGGAPHCTYDLLVKQIQNAVSCDAQLERHWNALPKDFADTDLGFGPKENYSLHWKPATIHLRSYEQLLNDGGTPLDSRYALGELMRAKQEYQAANNPPNDMAVASPITAFVEAERRDEEDEGEDEIDSESMISDSGDSEGSRESEEGVDFYARKRRRI